MSHNLVRLPSDLQMQAFSFLPYEDLMALVQVSRGTKKIALEKRIWLPQLKKHFPEHFRAIIQARTDSKKSDYFYRLFLSANAIPFKPPSFGKEYNVPLEVQIYDLQNRLTIYRRDYLPAAADQEDIMNRPVDWQPKYSQLEDPLNAWVVNFSKALRIPSALEELKAFFSKYPNRAKLCFLFLKKIDQLYDSVNGIRMELNALPDYDQKNPDILTPDGSNCLFRARADVNKTSLPWLTTFRFLKFCFISSFADFNEQKNTVSDVQFPQFFDELNKLVEEDLKRGLSNVSDGNEKAIKYLEKYSYPFLEQIKKAEKELDFSPWLSKLTEKADKPFEKPQKEISPLQKTEKERKRTFHSIDQSLIRLLGTEPLPTSVSPQAQSCKLESTIIPFKETKILEEKKEEKVEEVKTLSPPVQMEERGLNLAPNPNESKRNDASPKEHISFGRRCFDFFMGFLKKIFFCFFSKKQTV